MKTDYLPLNISVYKTEMKNENLCIMNAAGEDLKAMIYSFLKYIDNFQQIAFENSASEELLSGLVSDYSTIESLYKNQGDTLTIVERNYIRLIMKEAVANSDDYNLG